MKRQGENRREEKREEKRNTREEKRRKGKPSKEANNSSKKRERHTQQSLVARWAQVLQQLVKVRAQGRHLGPGSIALRLDGVVHRVQIHLMCA